MKAFLVGLGAAAAIGLGVYISVSNWNECRAIHSFIYCYTHH